MSDWIERDGKKYFEESYLTLANTLATKAVAKREQRIAALEAENAALRAELRTRIDLIMFDRRGLLGLIRSRLERAADAEGKNLHMLDLVDAVCSGVAALRADKDRLIERLSARVAECRSRWTWNSMGADWLPLTHDKGCER